MSVSPAILLIELLGHRFEPGVSEPRQRPVAARVEVVAASVTLDDLASNDGQTARREAVERHIDVRGLCLFERQVQVCSWLEGSAQVGDDERPLLGRNVLHRVDGHRTVEFSLERHLLQPDVLEPIGDPPGAGLGEHAR